MTSSARNALAGISLACLAMLPALPAAAEGATLITQEKALAGKVTPGDKLGFPVTISASGSYAFAGNLQVPAGKNGIVVAADNVTIELAGFRLAGGTLAAGGIVEGGANRSGITIRNGTITGFKQDAVRGTGSYWTVEDMRIVFNGGHGVSAGHMLQLRDSTLWINKLNGIVAFNWASILDSTIVGSGGNGVVCDNHCLVKGNLISQNGHTASGGVGVSANLGTVLGNTISGNQGFGISGSFTGYGNNTLVTNNSTGGGKQVSDGLFPLQPNACSQVC